MDFLNIVKDFLDKESFYEKDNLYIRILFMFQHWVKFIMDETLMLDQTGVLAKIC